MNAAVIFLPIFLLQTRTPATGPRPSANHTSPCHYPGSVYYRYVPVQIASTNANPHVYYQQPAGPSLQQPVGVRVGGVCVYSKYGFVLVCQC